MTTSSSPSSVVDLREVAAPERLAAAWKAFADLHVSEAVLILTDDDPATLRAMLEANYPNGYSWEETASEPWRIRVTKHSSTALPHVVVDAAAVTSSVTDDARGGAVWNLGMQERDLDANIVTLPAGDGIGSHAGPEVDVLIHVLAGSGHLHTETGLVDLRAGLVVWLPRRSQRAFAAGAHGLTYLTVHRRRRSSGLWPTSEGGRAGGSDDASAPGKHQ
ncbi:MAG TPA: DUF2249 domain-containing protein [Beutenbergiaceae bacterium]|nr:DUF2249 domain-containing protein [Beutenbergiaceae bacterium]